MNICHQPKTINFFTYNREKRKKEKKILYNVEGL